MIIRPAVIEDAAGLAWVRYSGWKHAYRGIVPDAVLDGMDYARDTARWRENYRAFTSGCFLYCAEMDGQVVGYCWGGPGRDQDPVYAGELYALYVLPEMQRCGVGWALMHAGMDWLLDHQFFNMLVWALHDNLPACRFYDALGGIPVRERFIEIGGVSLAEVGYGFSL
jgi:GNAT superfamily N-acetyltransferase